MEEPGVLVVFDGALGTARVAGLDAAPFLIAARRGRWSVFSSLPQTLVAVPAFLFLALFDGLVPVGLGFAGARCSGWSCAGRPRRTRHDLAARRRQRPRRVAGADACARVTLLALRQPLAGNP